MIHPAAPPRLPGTPSHPRRTRTPLTSPPCARPRQVPAIGREALYAAGYLGLYPVLKKKLDEDVSEGAVLGAVLGVDEDVAAVLRL